MPDGMGPDVGIPITIESGVSIEKSIEVAL